MIQFEAHTGEIYMRNNHNPKVLHPVPAMLNLNLSIKQAEVVAEVMTQLYKEGQTNMLNRVRAYIDQVETADNAKV